MSSDLPPKRNFHRRNLPDSCISFSSEEGKKIFAEALVTGYMNCYFRLAAQFRTQDEPAFCGLSTMVMVLNALNIDPGKVWKGSWRWYHENMLDCCVPLNLIETKGINLEQFTCVAACNSLEVKVSRADSTVTEEIVRDTIKKLTLQDDAFLVLTYSRKVLEQTGDGHFSPVGGYHPDRDLVLILDTARFKYPPHWVPLKTIFAAMQALDKDTGQPRGFIILSRKKHLHRLLLFRLGESLNATSSDKYASIVKEFIQDWQGWLAEKVVGERLQEGEADNKSCSEDVTEQAVRKLVDSLCKVAGNNICLLSTQLDIDCPQNVKKEHECVVKQLVDEMKCTLTFIKIAEIVNSLQQSEKDKLKTLFTFSGRCAEGHCRFQHSVGPQHFITALFLSWPYSCNRQRKTHACQISQNIENMLVQLPASGSKLVEEIRGLSEQLSIIVDFSLKSQCCKISCCAYKEK